MEVIYATGRPGHLDFYTIEGREDVPSGAIIFAICEPTHSIENTDEGLFDAITDQEYFTVQGMIYQAKIREAACSQDKRKKVSLTLELSVKRFFRWLGDSSTLHEKLPSGTAITE